MGLNPLQITPTWGFVVVVRDNTNEHNHGRVHRGTRVRLVVSRQPSCVCNRRCSDRANDMVIASKRQRGIRRAGKSHYRLANHNEPRVLDLFGFAFLFFVEFGSNRFAFLPRKSDRFVNFVRTTRLLLKRSPDPQRLQASTTPNTLI